ncbi:nicotinate-nucleotide pyrophosphorylase [Clostridium aceticum]|uniref:Probable nicotinate-nucleotide pyrophosphorylase [carboxylating] n=1 Tax=Clostridium aceticum TaxID=84022 RepID=A0A0D8I5N3_9CLOT|nr:carboxylating nicotinate-nucleotide diphosphorylase [Clostridium aceticum]AKL93540.1 nicotinate-nucleotide pyrophosphorylase [Clostridium aceticum]KJF25605.1 nicotinate-nucleotide pyrophosphorylase [Clostridium aceticum]
MYNKFLIEKIIKNALIEDINYIDLTTDILLEEDQMGRAIMIAKEEGVIAGISVVEMVFGLIDSMMEVIPVKKDGDFVAEGEKLIEIGGKIKNLLKGERIALNFLQRMSGIATKSRRYSELVKDYDVKVVDTRKTTPGLRILEKYAVRVGGCHNHRFNLSDAVLIKDNHIKAVGSITRAIDQCRKNVSHTVKIEVEVETIQQLKEALEAKADIIMLDNMSIETMKEAVAITNKSAILEASGNITKEKLLKIAEIGVDIISVGELTHSTKAMDISMNLVNEG